MWKLLQDSSKEDKEALLFSFAVKKNCHGGTQTRRREKAFPLCLRDSVAKTFMTEGDKPSSWTFVCFVVPIVGALKPAYGKAFNFFAPPSPGSSSSLCQLALAVVS